MKGMSYLGIGASKQFQDIVLREHPGGWAAKAFTQKSVFGDPMTFIQKLLDSGRCPLIGLNLQWKDSHVFTEADARVAQLEARRWKPIIHRYPSITWHVSGATEHSMPRDRATRYRDVVMGEIPFSNVQYVNQPLRMGALVDGAINERHGEVAFAHGPHAGLYSFDFDGTDCFDIRVEDYKAKFANASVFWWWTSQFNLKFNVDDKTPRPQRRAIPTPELIDAIIYLANTNQGAVKMPPKWLNKPKSDQHKVPPANRELKPVMIVPVNVPRLELVADNGQVVEVSREKDKFNDGRFRYYFSSRYGFQIAEKAKRIQGHPVLKVRANGKIYGTVNPAFRQGEFR